MSKYQARIAKQALRHLRDETALAHSDGRGFNENDQLYGCALANSREAFNVETFDAACQLVWRYRRQLPSQWVEIVCPGR